jgi:RNA polymerase primary sigma factor
MPNMNEESANFFQPSISEEEERKLAQQIKDANDDVAKQALADAHLPLVVAVVKSNYGTAGVPEDDLIKAGNLGLFKAVEKYNYKHNYRFAPYATWWVRQAIITKYPQLANN